MVTEQLVKWRYIGVGILALMLLVISPLLASNAWQPQRPTTQMAAYDHVERAHARMAEREATLSQASYKTRLANDVARLQVSHAALQKALQQKAAAVKAETAHHNSHIVQRRQQEALVGQLQARIDSLIRDVRRWEVKVSRARADYYARQTPAVPSFPGISAIKQYALNRVGAYQFQFLDKLWMKESGWRWNADNPTSDAYGIPQALPGSKMASAGADWLTNPYTQIRWGLGYIESVYGTCEAAWAHSVQYNWY